MLKGKLNLPRYSRLLLCGHPYQQNDSYINLNETRVMFGQTIGRTFPLERIQNFIDNNVYLNNIKRFPFLYDLTAIQMKYIKQLLKDTLLTGKILVDIEWYRDTCKLNQIYFSIYMTFLYEVYSFLLITPEKNNLELILPYIYEKKELVPIQSSFLKATDKNAFILPPIFYEKLINPQDVTQCNSLDKNVILHELYEIPTQYDDYIKENYPSLDCAIYKSNESFYSKMLFIMWNLKYPLIPLPTVFLDQTLTYYKIHGSGLDKRLIHMNVISILTFADYLNIIINDSCNEDPTYVFNEILFKTTDGYLPLPYVFNENGVKDFIPCSKYLNDETKKQLDEASKIFLEFNNICYIEENEYSENDSF